MQSSSTAAAHRRIFRRIFIAMVAVAALVGAAGGVAYAYWTSTGSGGASATTGTLNPPTSVTASQAAGSGTVNVSWTRSTGSPAPTGYYVTRKDSSNAVAAACGTSASATTSAATCTDSSVPLGSYTYTVVAVYRSWTATSAASTTVTVGKTSQSITFTSSPVAPTFGGTYAVSATATSGGPVTFGTSTAGVCTVTGSQVSFVHAGSCTITADQAGTTYYSAAPQATQAFTVAKSPQTIAFTSSAPTGATVGAAGYTPTASQGGSGNPVVLTIDASTPGCSIGGGVVTYQHAGSCTIDANEAGNNDYLAASQVQQSYAVGKGAQAVNFTTTPPSPAQVGGTYVVSAAATSGLLPVITLDAASTGCSLAGSTVTFTGAGTCKLDADQLGNNDYSPASEVQQSIVVTKVDQTITFTAPTGATATGTATLNGTASSGLTIAYTSSTTSVCTVSGSTVTYVAGGSCTINANQSGNTTFNAAPQVSQTFTVAKASQTITFTAPTGATAGNTATLNGTASSGLTIAYASSTPTVCTVSGSTVTYAAGGSCTITADQTGNGVYNAAPQVSQTFTVAKVNQTITFTAPTGATAGSTGTLNGTASSGLSVSYTSTTTNVCTVSGSTVTYLIAGTCTITADQAGNGTYNAAPSVARSFTVAGAPPATKFAIASVGTQTAGTSFSVTLTAQTATNTTATTYTGSHNITLTSTATNSPSGVAPTLPVGAATFTNGVATINGVKLVKAETGRTITASDGTISGTSALFDVVPGTAARVAFTSTTGSLTGCFFTCTKSGLGNNASGTAKVSITDSSGNTVTLPSGTPKTVTVTGSALTPTSPSFTMPTGVPAESTTSFTWQEGNGNYSDTITAASNLLTSATAALSK